MTFVIHTDPAGHSFPAAPGQTILTAALASGIGLPYGCRNGQCGSCTAALVAGTVDYPDGPPPALAGQVAGACITCQAVAQTDLVLRVTEIDTVADLPPRILPVRVAQKSLLNHDVMRLRLKLPDGQRLQYRAGQYLDVLLPDGRRRAFSMANAPHDDALLELHVRRVPGGSFTEQVFETLQEKAILRIQAPLGTFVLRETSEQPLIFVAGGTGFAPIKAILEQAFHAGVMRPITLYWGVRARRDLYLPDLPGQWQRAHGQFRFIPVLSEPDPDWTGRCGYVHEAVAADHAQLGGFDVYLSGPPPMVEASRRRFEQQGLPLTQVFSDAFEYAADTRKLGA